ncbi:MAG: fibronectin type III domain-containing protein [Chloroflexi bacterium]|nr:fibronectin type III domain-containing protein [Chloroflexota bacterium]
MLSSRVLQIVFIALLLNLLVTSVQRSTIAHADCVPGNQENMTTFATNVLGRMNIAVSQFALDAFAHWEPYENTVACWNPLATTLPEPGSWPLSGNSAGVQNYPDESTGELANSDTLVYTPNGSGTYYKAIRDMLSLQSFNWQAVHDSLIYWIGSEAYATNLTNDWQSLWNTEGGGGGSSCPNPTPSSTQVVIFANTGYGGNCVVLGVGDYPDPSYLGSVGNDNAESIRVGSSVQAILCKDDNYAGGCTSAITSDTSDLSSTSIGNNQLSSLHVQNRSSSCSYSSDQVVIYANTGYSGSCVVLGVGDYPNPSYLGSVGNDNAESIRVGSSVQAILCKDDNYAGGCTSTITSDTSDLSSTSIGNNQLSSLHVQNRGGGGSCPVVSGIVDFYDLTNCQGSWAEANAPGLWTLEGVLNDQAESVAIPSGWSVRLYKDNSTSSPSVCIPSTTNDLRNYNYSDGSSAANSVTWFNVYDQNNCSLPAPSPPSNPNPSDGTTLERTNNTTLYWSTDGTTCDVHIWGGNIDITPTGGSCANLFLGTQYGGSYQWQVTAHNSSGATAGPTWHFYIKPYGPASLNASAGSTTQINLSWAKSADDPGNVDNYAIYYSSGTLITTVGAGATSYNVSGLNCNVLRQTVTAARSTPPARSSS